jgi:hypothetical protein
MLLDAENEKGNIFYVRYGVLMAVNMKITVLDLSMFQRNLLPPSSGYPQDKLQHIFYLKI